MIIDAYHLAGSAAGAGLRVIAQHDGVVVRAPVLSPEELGAVCRRLIAARARLLALPGSRVVRAIDAAARRLRSGEGGAREQVLRALTAITGYAPAMAELVLDRMSEDWLEPALQRLLDVELGGDEAVTAFISRPAGMRSRAVAPALGLHVFAGNVPGVAVTSMVRALLVRSAVLGKCGVEEPVLAAVFARLLHEADADVGAAVAITYWQGGDTEREAAVLEHAGLVVHYGGAESIRSLSARAPAGVRFVEHGPRIAFVVVNVDAGAPPEGAARDLARAVAMFDQQGCVSPQLAYVVGADAAAFARHFAADVARELALLQPELPRGRISAAEAAAIRELRTRAEFGGIAGRDLELFADPELTHTVIYTGDVAFEGTCLNRTLLVKPATALKEVLAVAAPFGRYLQTVGVAGWSEADLPHVAAQLGDIGVTRVTTIRDMPFPPPTWHHDGRGPLRELVRWVDLESPDTNIATANVNRRTMS